MFCTCHELAFGLEKFHLYFASQSSFEAVLFHFHKTYSLNVNYSILFPILLQVQTLVIRSLSNALVLPWPSKADNEQVREFVHYSRSCKENKRFKQISLS